MSEDVFPGVSTSSGGEDTDESGVRRVPFKDFLLTGSEMPVVEVDRSTELARTVDLGEEVQEGEETVR